MQFPEHFDSIGINRREDGESRADSGPGNVHEASVGSGGLHRIHDALSALQADSSGHEPDYTPAEKYYIEDFQGGSGELPHGLA